MRAGQAAWLAAVVRGDLDQVLRQFRGDCELVFVSHTAPGARLSGKADLLRWFERFRRLLPDPSFDVQRLVIGGPVWDQRIAAHVIIRSRVAGEPYENEFAQFLTVRWGRVVEERSAARRRWLHAHSPSPESPRSPCPH